MPPQSRNSASGMIRRKIATHLTTSQGSISARSPNFVPDPRVEQVDRDRGRVDLGELEGHLDPLARRLAEVEDPADAGLQPRLLDGVDRPQPALVAHRRGDLVVVASAPSRRCGGRAARPPRAAPCARSADMWPIEAQRFRLVCSATSRAPSSDLREVALRQPLALGDHAEAVSAGRLGGPGVLEDLLGLHHRVHRRVGLGVARLGAEPAVLGAAARLGVDQRAHVGRVAEVLPPHLPGALDQLRDLVVVA